MKITKIRIRNFKGFRDTGWLELAGAFNVVVGQNNSGKSAFLEAFRLQRAKADPFRSELASEPHEIGEQSTFDLDVELPWSDWVEAINSSGGQAWIPFVADSQMTPEYHLEEIRSALKYRPYYVTVSAGGG